MIKNYLFDLIKSRISDRNKTFLETIDGGKITYGDLLEQSAQYANAVVSAGVEPGDRVVVQVDKSPQMLFLYLGCLQSGAVLVPLNTAYTAAELEYFIGDSDPKLVVCSPNKITEITAIVAGKGISIETLGPDGSGSLPELARGGDVSFSKTERRPDDMAAILYTSGTTGRSKGAMLTHANLASNALTLVDLWRFTQDDVLIHALPIYHTHCLFVATNIALLANCSMIFLPKFDPDIIINCMLRATVMMGVPTFYTRLLSRDGLARQTTKHMRLFISGSAPLLAETHGEWQKRTGHAILERYGMTETNMNTSNPYDGDRIAGTVGFPLPGVEVRIAQQETGALADADDIGIIEVRGPNVFKGYWRNPEKTAEEFRSDGFFITGDLGRIDPRGYVHIVGRGKDLIITGGFNVYPKEVEDEINACSGVIESAVIGLPHADLGEGVTAIVILEAGSKVDAASILSTLDGRLAKFKTPKQIIFENDLPRNAMGKVQKNLLRTKYEHLYKG